MDGASPATVVDQRNTQINLVDNKLLGVPFLFCKLFCDTRCHRGTECWRRQNSLVSPVRSCARWRAWEVATQTTPKTTGYPKRASRVVTDLRADRNLCSAPHQLVAVQP